MVRMQVRGPTPSNRLEPTVHKTDLLNWIDREIEGWETFLDAFGRDNLEQPNVNGTWSMKDVIAHLTEWTRGQVALMRAVLRGQPDPAPAWPAEIHEEADINAWIYTTHKDRAVNDVLVDCRETLRQLRAFIQELPDDTRIDEHYRQVHIGGRTFAAGEFFDHFHDDHEPNVRGWLARLTSDSSSPARN